MNDSFQDNYNLFFDLSNKHLIEILNGPVT